MILPPPPVNNFDHAVGIILQHEGREFTDNPNDSGGATKFGITQKTLREFYSRPTTIEDVRNLAESEAKEIYQALFWKPLMLGRLPSSIVATVILDQAILAGIPTVVRIIQKMLKLPVDGIMGPITIETIGLQVEKRFCLNFLIAMTRHYKEICEKNPSEICFLKGWENRVIDLMQSVFPA